MGREYKFRGKRIDNGEWVVGYYIRYEHMGVVRHIIVTSYAQVYVNSHDVAPETVGQYTGKLDEEKNEIYDGDKLFAPGFLSEELEYVGTVIWDNDDNRWDVTNMHGRFEWIPNGCVVRGNKWESAEVFAEGHQSTE